MRKKLAVLLLAAIVFAGCEKQQQSFDTYEPAADEKSSLPRVNEILPFPVYAQAQDNEEAALLYAQAKEEGKKNNFTPLIVYDDAYGYIRERLKTMVKNKDTWVDEVKQQLKLTDQQDVSAYFQNRQMEYQDLFSMSEEHPELILGDDALYPGMQYKQEKIFIFSIPTSSAYEILSYVPLHFNDQTPEPILFTAVLKYWERTYGMQLVVMAHDTLQFEVTKQLNDAEALQLAKELVCMTPSLVETSGSIENVAYNIQNSKHHYVSLWFL